MRDEVGPIQKIVVLPVKTKKYPCIKSHSEAILPGKKINTSLIFIYVRSYVHVSVAVCTCLYILQCIMKLYMKFYHPSKFQ